MSFEPTALFESLSEVLIGTGTRDNNGTTVYRLKLGEVPAGCAISSAELLVPKDFPDQAVARIRLSKAAVLQVPHVELDGLLCIEGDPGPGRGLDGVQRIQLLVRNFYDQFFYPWCRGELDGDFAAETQNYWGVNVAQYRTDGDIARKVWTVDDIPPTARVREGILLLPGKIIIANDDDKHFTQRIILSLGPRAKQHVHVIIADIPISRSFVPETWPKDVDSLLSVVRARLKLRDYNRFAEQVLRKRRKREHRLALFRNHEGGFAFLLPGSPPAFVKERHRYRLPFSYLKIQPLIVERIDPSWTVGRDQIPEVSTRQQKHIVVFGAGALGSQVVEQLAKSGVGKITLADSDSLETANLGRHLLGTTHLGYLKSVAVANELNLKYPSCVVKAYEHKAERWLRSSSLQDVDLVLDLTGEPEVRWHLNEARRKYPCKLLLAWMEPFAAAAHVCLLQPETLWLSQPGDENRLKQLEAVDWPAEVIRRVPGCSSRFQAYTSVNAAYAVALTSENALRFIDDEFESSIVLSWVRGQDFLNKHWPGLKHREWATDAAKNFGITIARPFT